MSPLIAMSADLLVAVLLVATILTCLRLSRRISTLKTDEGAMRATIGELMVATDAAERAIAGLRATVGEGDRNLAQRLKAAETCFLDLTDRVAAGENVIERLEQIASASRRAIVGLADSQPSSAAASLRAASASALAVAERAQRRLGRAA